MTSSNQPFKRFNQQTMPGESLRTIVALAINTAINKGATESVEVLVRHKRSPYPIVLRANSDPEKILQEVRRLRKLPVVDAPDFVIGPCEMKDDEEISGDGDDESELGISA